MKILVDAPSGAQELIEIGEGGGYFDSARVLWDERTIGPLPAITLGGMKRAGAALVFDQARMAAHLAAIKPAVPQVIPMRNARRILYANNLLTTVEATINGLPGELGDLARIDWATALTVNRTDPIVTQVIPALGRTEEQIDAMFIAAAELG